MSGYLAVSWVAHLHKYCISISKSRNEHFYLLLQRRAFLHAPRNAAAVATVRHNAAASATARHNAASARHNAAAAATARHNAAAAATARLKARHRRNSQ